MKRKVKIIILSILIIIWGTKIFMFSSENGENSQNQSTDAVARIITNTINFTNKLGLTKEKQSKEKIYQAAEVLDGPARKIMHQAEYFILAILVMMLVNILLCYKKYILSIIVTLISCIIFASSDELHQTFVMGRTGQLKDVIVDTTGMIYAILIYTTYYYTYQKGRKSNLINNKKSNS